MKTADRDAYKAATDTVVAKLNDEAKKNVGSWLAMGQSIAQYIDSTKQAPGDAFKRLAEHEDCDLGASSLRSYYAAWKLWTAMGKDGVPASVEYTHFVVAATSAINFEARLKLLQQAEKDGWSVSELKKQILLLRNGANRPEVSPDGENGEATKKAAASIDWKTACKTLESQTARLIEDMNFMGSLNSEEAAPKELRQNIRRIVQLAITMGLIDRAFILDNMHDEMGRAA